MTASGTRPILPPLSPEEARPSAAVAALIHAELAAAAGWLSFERFMELALYAPGLGYYSAGSFKIGAGGDFVTAPEVSDLFGRCLARQCAEVLAVTGGGDFLVRGGRGGQGAAALPAPPAPGGVPPHPSRFLRSAALFAPRSGRPCPRRFRRATPPRSACGSRPGSSP